MASVSISLYQKRETIETGYRVTSEVTSATDIEKQLFVYKYIDGTGPEWNGGNDLYQHVANVSDIKTYPVFTDIDPNDVPEFYRHEKSVLDFGILSGAIDQAAVVKERMEDLATDFDEAVEAFSGTESYNYQSDDASVSFDLEQVQSQVAADNYRVTSTIQAGPTGISRDLFLFELTGASPNPSVDTYTRVCTTDDLNEYPNVAGWVSETYYRNYDAQVDNALMGNAETLSATIQTDLGTLAQTYDDNVTDFEGEETTVYTS